MLAQSSHSVIQAKGMARGVTGQRRSHRRGAAGGKLTPALLARPYAIVRIYHKTMEVQFRST